MPKTKYVNYKCKDCKASFGCQITAYKQHILDNHATHEERKKIFSYYCKYCDTGTFSSSTWNNHISTKKHKKMEESHDKRK